MSHAYEEVRQHALELSYDDRAKLSQELWESLHPPGDASSQDEIDASWDEEIKRRIEEIDSGTVELIPAEQVLAELRAKIAGARKDDVPPR
jgi:putative addiction module component (TIGR02574 family)